MKLIKLLSIALFAIFTFATASAQTITVSSPNGGEIWAGCTVHNITWTGVGTSGFYNVDYSTDGGTSWTSLATNLNATSYSWTVPNTTSTTCLVRVYQYGSISIIDQSNAVFTINAPLILTSPNGGEVWQVGGPTHNITWAASGTGTYLTIQYSTDLGATWTTITTTAVATSGTYTWTIPNTPSTNCLVKIYDNSTSCMTDNSNGLFTISAATPVITVTAPNTAVTYYVANSYTITWTSAYLVSSFVKIDYSTDNGTTWIAITASTSNTGSYTWTVPNTPSVNCLVRVTDFGSSAYDVSNVNFTIASAYVTLNSPNGGENWNGCSTQTISWTRYGTTANDKVEYSIDNGTTWNTITASTSATSISWSVPNTPSTTCLVRVTDLSLSVSDASNATFNITANTAIIVTSPNGGEVWQVGGPTHNITWSSTTGYYYYNIDYSTDGGVTWINIASTYYTTTYTFPWTIPNTPSTNCKVRVTDYYNNCQTDMSNAVFTISPPTPVITVTAPNTAVTYYVANSYTITWTSAYLVSSFVKIEYSTDNGTTWITITSSTNNTGSYAWTVPNTPSVNCLVRVTDFGGPTSDVSNTNFTIASAYVVLNSPNGGESWNGCSTQTISWTRYGTSANDKVEYSLDNGTTWNTITASTSATSISWSVPNTPSTTCLVKVTDLSLSVTDVSNAVFTITANSAIVVTAPNGGEVWQVGGPTHTITWASTTGYNYFNIDYSTDGGVTWINIASTYYTTTYSYTWTIPNTPSTNCKVRVTDYYNNCQTDMSNAVFTISAPTPTITVTAPNTAVTYYVANTYTITWTSAYLSSSFVVLDYSTNNGLTWISITSAYNNTGNYSWTVPNTPSTQCLVRVSDYGNPLTYDVSNVNFTIASAYIVLNTPNGGESWGGCSTQTISWSRFGTSSNDKVEYSINNGTTWNTITASTSATSISWSIPNTPSTTCLVRVTDLGLSVTDVSNATFTITQNLSIIVTAPNGGEVWQVGGPTHTITWASSTGYYYYNIDYSTDGGLTWINIASTYYTTTYSYVWTIPNTPSTNCLVRVTDYYNSCQFDVSNAVFTISAPTPVITVTAPNTAVTYYVGNTYSITWTSAYLSSSFVKLEYSTDNGTTWTTITASTSNTGSYSWLVPNTPSTTCLVRASDAANPSTNDVSNTTFTIASPYIVLNTPNGGENWTGCSTQTISWTRYGTSANDKVEYSTNNGTTWTTITASTSATSISWSIPNTPSTTCLVRVTDLSLSLTDVSNATFTIVQNSAIIVSAPNGGEVWQVGGPTHTITWASSTGYYYYNIDYSTDGGATWINIASTYYTTTYSYVWTIPNTPSTNCLVRVTDYYNSCQYDVSNAVFTISAPTPVITVTAPNTAVTYYVANAYTISWTSAYLSSSFVRLDYSTDNGTTWINITPSTNNTGSYSWTVPNTPSVNCLVKASDYGNPSTFDVSNVDFTIASPYLVVNTPNGGETWNGCTTQTISWTRYGTSNNDKVEYSIDGGTTWTIITAGTSATSISWTIPNTPSNNCLVRVTDVTLPAVTDMSNSTFHITQNVTIVLNSPNGGEVWQVGGPTQLITWASSTGYYYYNIDYSTDGGVTWTNIVSTYYTTTYSYVWTIPNTPSTNCKVRVTDYYNNCQTDMSNNVFTILAPTPTITVTYPNTATTLYVSSTYNITWSSAYLCSTFVIIQYSTDNGATWITISSAATNTGSYSWLVPNTVSATCLVKVTDYGCTGTYDVSNVDFAISPAIVITTPNGGETLNSCTTSSINWTAGGCSGSYKLEYSTNNGTTWTTIVSSYSAAGTGSCSYTWSSVPNFPSGNCLVRVTDVSSAVKTDQSNAVFTIAPAITVTQPNFGGSYTVGSVLNINWTSNGVSNYYNIDYSTNAGSTWTSIVFNSYITTNTYAWTVPNFPSTNCLVRVTDNVNSCKTDMSDVVFTISTTASAITVTSPNGGENWSTCSSQNITWNATGASGSYNLDYSTNGGTTWTSITTGYAAAGSSCSYSWTIPNTVSTSCLVRVTDAVVTSRTDQSDAAFTISNSVLLAATGGTTICAGQSASLSATGSTSYSWLPSASLSNAAIANPVATPSSTTTYTVTGTTGSCTNTATVTVVVNPIPNVTATPSAPGICTGGSTTLVANGASTYSWSPTTGLSNAAIYNPVANPSSTTTYTVTGTLGGCTNTATSTVTVTAVPVVTAGGTSPICSGTSTSLNASGATTYSWSPGTGLSSTSIANPTASPSTTITYTITGTTAGCSSTTNLTISVNPLPTILLSGGGNICNGNSASLTASGAGSYSWLPTTGLSNPSISNPTANPTSTTTYTVTGTSSGCSNTSTMTLNVVNIPTVSITGSTTICGGTSTSLTASGASTYTWSPATGLSSTVIANPTAYPSSTTTYTVTGNTSGCTGSNTVTVNITGAPVVTVTGAGSICAGSSTNLVASGASTYTWLPATGLSNAGIANPVASPSSSTTYTVTGSNGCTGTTTAAVTVIPIPTVTVSGTNTICNGSNTVLTAIGATNYVWLPATGLSSDVVANPTASPTSSTTYTVTGSTGSCSSTASYAVTVNPVPTVTSSGDVTICAGTSTGLTAGGATTYSWSPSTGLSNPNISNPTASPSSTTTYTVTGTSLGCSNTATVTVTVTSLPVLTATGGGTICNGASANLSVGGASTYSWSPAATLSASNIFNPVATPTSSTTYTVTGTDLGCSSTQTVTVNVIPLPTISVSGTTTLCTGTNTTLTASGATTYMWSPATDLSNPTIANPVASPTSDITYTVTGTTGSCSNTTTVTVYVYPVPVVALTGGTTICSGTSTPLTASGAASYSWSPATGLSSASSANPTASPSTTTTYTVTGTSGSCSDTAQVTVFVNLTPTISVSGTTSVCTGGSSTLTASGATDYSWSPSTGLSSTIIANPVANPGNTTTYIVTGTTNGCSNTYTVVFTVNPIPVVTATGDATICSGTSTPLNAYGATTYSWTPGTGLSNSSIANPSANPTSTTTYVVTGTTSGCSANASVTVTVNPAPVASFSYTGSPYCIGGTNPSPTFSGGGVAGTFTSTVGLSINSSTGVVDLTTSTPGTYTVTNTIAASSGCSAVVATSTITISATSVATFSYTGTPYCSNVSNPSPTFTGGGVAGTFTSSPAGLSINSLTGIINLGASAAGTYTVTNTIGASGGCAAVSANATVTVVSAPVASAGSNVSICTGTSTTLNGSGGTTYSWLPATGLSNASIANPVANPTSTTTYTLTVGNGTTCFGTSTVTVTVNAMPTVSVSGTTTICSGSNTALTASGATSFSWTPATGLSNASIANPVASPTSTTTYTVTGTTGGCSSTSTITITVNPSPTASAGSPVSICSGTNTTLNASGGLSYSWSPSTGLSSTVIANPVASPTSTTTYTVTVGNGTCSSSASVTVTVNPTPTASAGSNVTIACGGTTTLGASGGTSYSWSPATGLSNPNIANPVCTPPYTTTYTVTVSNGTCSSTASVTVTTGTLTVNAGPDVTLCTGSSATLAGSSTGGGGGTWVNVHTSYNFTQNVGTYGTITGGTLLFDSTAATGGMDENYVNLTIPSFKFNNITYTSCYVSSNGIIDFGATAPPIYPTVGFDSPINNAAGLDGIISAWGADINASAIAGSASEVRAGLIGSKIYFQWKDVTRYGYNDRFSFQVILDTATNVVQTMYSQVLNLSVLATYPEIGLRGPTNTWGTDVNNRMTNSTTLPWVNSVAGTTNASTMTFDGTYPSAIPASGTTFTWTPATSSTTYAWAPATGLSSTTILTPVANPTTTTTYTLTATSGTCTAVDYVTVTVTSGVVNAGADVSICSGTNTTLHATGSSTYTWSPATGLSSTTVASPVASPASTTTYTVTGVTGTCSTTDAVVVTVVPQPTANAGADVTICSGSSTTLNASGGTTYSWLPTTGLSNPSIANPVASPTSTTTYTVTAANGICTSTDIVIVYVNPSPTANAGADVSICNGSSTTLNATGGTSYSWLPTTGLSNPSIASPVASPTSTTTYTVTSSNGTCTATDMVVVTVNPTPAANAGADVTICNGGSTPLVATGGIGYSWSPATGLSNAAIANPTASPAGTTSYTVTVSNGFCTATDVIVVTVIAPPVANAGADVTVCAGTPTTLNATGGTSYSWLPATALSNASIASPVATPVSTTSYTVSVSNGYCSTTDVVVVTVNAAPGTNAGADIAICSGGSTSLNGSGTGISYAWSPSAGLSDTTILNPVANPTSTTTYVLTISNGTCTTSDAITVTVSGAINPISSLTGLATVCDGSTNTYSVVYDAGVVSYTWSMPAAWTGGGTTNSISPVAHTTGGYVTVYGTNGCGSTLIDSINVTVNPSPTVTISPLGFACVNWSPFALTAGSPAGGTYSGTGVSGGTVFAPSVAGAGTYMITYTYTNGSGCSGTASDTIHVDLCTSVASANDNVDVTASPNPFTDYTILSVDNSLQLINTEVIVFDMFGRKVMDKTGIDTHQIRIDRTNLRTGIYFYKFINDDKVIGKGKLVISE